MTMLSPLHILSLIAIILAVVAFAWPSYTLHCAVVLLGVANFLR